MRNENQPFILDSFAVKRKKYSFLQEMLHRGALPEALMSWDPAH
jgi:hypothetical protein